MPNKDTLTEALTKVLNQYNADTHANTPDYILAKYLFDCLWAFTVAMKQLDMNKGVEVTKTFKGTFRSETKVD